VLAHWRERYNIARPAQGSELAGTLGQGKVAVLQRIRTVRDNCQALLDRTQTAACTHAVILRAGPPGVIEKLDKGEAVDPRSYYFRMNPMFETSAPKYDWMNRIIAIGTGHRLADGPLYSVFEVL
jgi:enoyl reductase-like protein